MTTCTVCGRDDAHADWCEWVTTCLRERAAGMELQQHWPAWLTPAFQNMSNGAGPYKRKAAWRS